MISDEVSARAALGGFKVYEIMRCCSPCFGAKCLGCGEWLTKHDFDPEGAAACAEQAFSRTDRWRHECSAKADVQLELGLTA